MYSRGAIPSAAELFKCMGDPTRLEILCLLSQKERQVSDLAQLLKHSQSGVSHQLRLLRTLRLVKSRRKGRNIFYSLDDSHVGDLIKVALAHSEESK